MEYLAIIPIEGTNNFKYQISDNEQDLLNHVDVYGGFVVDHPGGVSEDWDIDFNNETITYSAKIHDTLTELERWEKQMAESDFTLIPRYIEDIIDVLTPSQKEDLSQYTLDKHSAKKILRGNKPV